MNLNDFIDSLKNYGYKRVEKNINKINNVQSDFMYQKKINEYMFIICYFYELIDNDKVVYDYEFEMYEEVKDSYCRCNRVFSINKNLSIEDIENILRGNKQN